VDAVGPYTHSSNCVTDVGIPNLSSTCIDSRMKEVAECASEEDKVARLEVGNSADELSTIRFCVCGLTPRVRKDNASCQIDSVERESGAVIANGTVIEAIDCAFSNLFTVRRTMRRSTWGSAVKAIGLSGLTNCGIENCLSYRGRRWRWRR